MNLKIDIADIIGLTGTMLSMLAAVIFIFLNRNRSIPKTFLTIAIIALGYAIFVTIFLETRLILQYPFLYRTAMPAAMVIGPSVYYYLISELTQPLVFPKKYFLHLIPSLVTLFFFLPYHFLPTHEKIEIINHRYSEKINMIYGGEGIISGEMIGATLGIYTLLYLLQSLRLIVRNRIEIVQADEKSLSWYYYLIAVFGLIFIFLLFAAFRPESSIFSYFTLVTSLLNFSLVVFLFTHPDILYGTLAAKIEDGSVKRAYTNEDATLNESQSLTEDQIEVYSGRFERYLIDDQPFLNRKLRITDLAEKLDIPRHHLSWLLNNVYEMNFNDYINQARLRYIEENFTSEKFRKMTLEGIAYEAGFNSRTTFTHAVKKFYSKTPSEHFKYLSN